VRLHALKLCDSQAATIAYLCARLDWWQENFVSSSPPLETQITDNVPPGERIDDLQARMQVLEAQLKKQTSAYAEARADHEAFQ